MRTINHLINKRADQHPDKIFLLAPEANLSLTYKQLKEDCIIFGKHLVRLGLKKGDKVSFFMGNGYQTAKIYLGAIYSGFMAAPVNLMAHPDQLEYVLVHSDTTLIFFSVEQEDKLRTAVRKIKRDISLISADPDTENLFSGKDTPAGFPLPDIDENDDALLLYTSGTTGLPSGVVLSHRNLVSGGQYTVDAHGVGTDDRALCSLPLYHINGEIVTLIAPLVSGGSVVMPHKFSASHFWKLLSDYGCSWFSVVPTIISYLYNTTDLKDESLNLDRLRFGRSASAPLPPSLQSAFEEKYNIPIIETMGLTETAAPICSNPMELSKRKFGSPGIAVGNEIKIVDQTGIEVERGIQGEIMIRGDNVMKCYYKNPEKTAKTIDPGGWLHSGDLGCIDEDGFLFVTGRIKEIIIKGGENIAPKEIDDILYKHPKIQDAAAVGIPDESFGEDILACVVLKSGCTATEEELYLYCKEHLGEFKAPKVIKIMTDLPKGPSGKIQRLKLRDVYHLETNRGVHQG